MLGIYIHIPFCLSKCPYCDFYSLPYREELAQQYVQAAVRAVETAPAAGQAVDSVYFGGGTPVLLGEETSGGFVRGAAALCSAAGKRDHAGGKPRRHDLCPAAGAAGRGL